jgi:hypothetical protein
MTETEGIPASVRPSSCHRRNSTCDIREPKDGGQTATELFTMALLDTFLPQHPPTSRSYRVEQQYCKCS